MWPIREQSMHGLCKITKNYILIFLIERAHAVWCLSKNRLECFVIVIKSKRKLEQDNFSRWSIFKDILNLLKNWS